MTEPKDPRQRRRQKREPVQARARERVGRILAAAEELIAAHGADALKMNEIAERAGVPIGSLYQYFPDKSAIILTLADRFNERVHQGLVAQWQHVTSLDEARQALRSAMRAYYDFIRAEPVLRDIWSGTQVDPELQQADIADSRRNGELVWRKLAPLVDRAQKERLKITCFMMMQLTGAAVRLAVSVEHKEGDAIIEEFTRLLEKSLIVPLRGDS